MRPTAVDAIVLRNGKVLLVRREFPPFKNHWAIPGGFVEADESVEEAVVRETYEETGMKVKVLSLVGVYSNPRRDQKRGTIAIAFLVRPLSRRIRGSIETSEVKWFKLNRLPKLAFDHARIIKDAKEVLR